MRKLVLLALSVASAGFLISTTAAAAAHPATATASIGLDQSAPVLGDTVTFTTSVPKLAGWEYPMVALACFQDVNDDGTIDTGLLGPDIVFSWLDMPSAPFVLGGYASIWTQRGGGPAVCRADLDAYGWRSGSESIRVLATTGDWAAGG